MMRKQSSPDSHFPSSFHPAIIRSLSDVPPFMFITHMVGVLQQPNPAAQETGRVHSTLGMEQCEMPLRVELMAHAVLKKLLHFLYLQRNARF